MTQETAVAALVVIYTASSFMGAALFTYIWRLTHLDMRELQANPNEDEEAAKRECAVARRNRAVAGVLSCTFYAYCVVGTISSLRLFGIADFPWVPGLVTTAILVAANFFEMLVGWVLVRARRAMTL